MNLSAHVIKSSQPSPLSASKTEKPFLGSRVYIKINTYLQENGIKKIDW